MHRHIGIVAFSPPGASLCFELICTEISKLEGEHVEVSVHAHAFDEYMRYINADDWDSVSRLLLSSARKLASAGAEFVLLPCNTAHHAFDRVAAQSPVPWMHIGEEVAREAKMRGFRRMALLGTSLLMEGQVYPRKLAAVGVEYRIPSPHDRRQLNRYIIEEMVRGRFTVEARTFLLELVHKMADEGCDAVGLCCTELPILLANTEPSLPVLDSTRVLANAAVRQLMASARQPCSTSD